MVRDERAEVSMEQLNEKEYRIVRPWIRLILGVIFDLRYRITVDDWSTKQCYYLADEHLTEFEMFPSSIERKTK